MPAFDIRFNRPLKDLPKQNPKGLPPTRPAWRRAALIAALGGSLVASSRAQTPIAVSREPSGLSSAQPAPAETIVLPESVPDPIEPFNRAVWAFNKRVMSDVIQPTSKVYRFFVRNRVRTGIGNMGRNLTYPGRLINNLLQGKWGGARDESHRFVCNTIAGVAGFFDVASRWGIPKSDADFGQTLGQWGWDPACFLMLPFLGPSNERDTLGLTADTAANPLLYISPYKFQASRPLTYLGPYTYFSYGVAYNDLSDSVDEYVRRSQAAADSYSEIQYAWTFVRKARVAELEANGEPDAASLETLQSALFTFKDLKFPGRGTTRSVLIPSTGRKLKFTFWMRPGKAPVAYIVPGLGSHRLATPSIALAELAYRNGFSAVCVSSAFNTEFMEQASTAAMPASLPVDGRDLRVALSEIDRQLRKSHPDRLGQRALMGYSMGALHTLYVAATEAAAASEANLPSVPGQSESESEKAEKPGESNPLITFDRYVAIHTPVRLAHGMTKLDEFFEAPLNWPAADRTQNIEDALLKVASLSRSPLAPESPLPFGAIESRFLIGMTFRFLLRDVIYSSQRRNDQGVLRHRFSPFRRQPIYEEILQYSYQDYFEKFAIPYYQTRTRGLASQTAEALEKAGDLRTYEAGLRSNSNVRILVNQNDFLLADGDLAWLRASFGPEQLTVFEKGGHLGNLFKPEVQEAIVGALAGLK